MELFHNKSLVEKKVDEVVIRVIFVTNEKKCIDKKYKEHKSTDKKTWDFGRFLFGRDYKYG